MTLVDRYLKAVRFFLPHRQQDDILRELAENLASQIEDRSVALDRDLTEDEVADILRRHGHPALVAARFAPRQHLIGPTFFPLYVMALKLGLAVALVVTVAIGVIGTALKGASLSHFVDVLLSYPDRALIVFAWTTIGFAVVDAMGSRTQVKPDWDPRKLPDWMAGARPQPPLHQRFQAIAEVVMGAVALVWLLAIPQSPWLAMGPLAAMLTFAPVWHTWYAPMVLVAAASVGLDAWAMFQPARSPRLIITKLTLLGCQGVIVLAILSARGWVEARPALPAGQVPAEKLPALVQGVNIAIAIGLAVLLVITLFEMGKQYYRLRQSTTRA